MSGALDISETSSSYGHRYIFLYIGGFILAIAIEKWNLHKRIALTIISFIGTEIKRLILGFMIATAFLSMWISNVATTAMMVPIMEAVLIELESTTIGGTNSNANTRKALAMSVMHNAKKKVKFTYVTSFSI